MKIEKKFFLVCQLLFVFSLSTTALSQPWKAAWIVPKNVKSDTNTWVCFRKKIKLSTAPKNLTAKIAVDSKYWLLINGELVVFEGGLKRGPNPNDTYYDEVEIGKYLKKGDNVISILVWYWGKDGFSHKSSGKTGLIFEASGPSVNILTDMSWKATKLAAYSNTGSPFPNFRLPETNIRYDANKEPGNFWTYDYDDDIWDYAQEFCTPPCSPWNNLVKRPIPLFKFTGLKEYINQNTFPKITNGDPIIARLPYNAQVTPYFKIKAAAGLKLSIYTDDYFAAGNKDYATVRDEYITKEGVQEFEFLGWMNGHAVHYQFPAGVEIISLKYRESGYKLNQDGSFLCNEEFFNKLWSKAQRTLYVNMRDTYFDCPDRERAAWIADVVNEIGQSAYAFDTAYQALAKKCLQEFVNWQKDDFVLHSPVPAGDRSNDENLGSWGKELPHQVLNTISPYGVWNYYIYSGDKNIIAITYPRFKNYLSLYKLNEDFTVVHRTGAWDWGDWGSHIDFPLLDNAWYIMALDGMAKMADYLKLADEAAAYRKTIEQMKQAFNKKFWNGSQYRSPEFTGETDDRGNALAVLSGCADSSKYKHVKQILVSKMHASPNMEKYVLEALYKMNYPEAALDRMKKRYKNMVDTSLTTLWELFVLDQYATYNHAWAGGPLTLLSQYGAGVSPVEPAYNAWSVKPQPGYLKEIKTTTITPKGKVEVAVKNTGSTFEVNIHAPEKLTGYVSIPSFEGRKIMANGQLIWEMGKSKLKTREIGYHSSDQHFITFKVTGSKWNFRSY